MHDGHELGARGVGPADGGAAPAPAPLLRAHGRLGGRRRRRGPGGSRQGGGGVPRGRRDRTTGELAGPYRPQNGPGRIASPPTAGGGPVGPRPAPGGRSP